MTSVAIGFFFFALVILVGFITSRVFHATRFPDIPLLLCIGLVLGPLNRAAAFVAPGLHNEFVAQVLDVDLLRSVLPFVSQLALVIILFDSGLRLDVREVAKGFRPALLHALPVMAATVAGIAAIGIYVWGLPPLVAVVLGVALSNLGQTVSAPIIRHMRIAEETRSIYFVEMAIYDVISIPLLVGILEFAASNSADPASFAAALAGVAAVSIVLGGLAGLVWIYVLNRIEEYPNTYMVTLAFLLLVYSVTSFAGGNGAVAALVFGLVVGNRSMILPRGGKAKPVGAIIDDEKVHSFHAEITFLIRSFFFVFLGIMFGTASRPEGTVVQWPLSVQWPGTTPLDGTAGLFLLGTALILAAIVGLRWLVVRLFTARGRKDRATLSVVFARGLGTAVLCALPFSISPYLDRREPYYSLFRPFEPLFFDVALLIILLTVGGTAYTVWRSERKAPPAPAGEPLKEPARVSPGP